MSDNMPPIDESLDARKLQCPMPLLKAKQSLNRMAAGQVLEVLATDAGSWRDFHAFAEQGGHRLLLAEDNASNYRYLLQKAVVTGE